jgi:8-oxo-dGTP pyrophosphatase MutT (NUDIX family)
MRSSPSSLNARRLTAVPDARAIRSLAGTIPRDTADIRPPMSADRAPSEYRQPASTRVLAVSDHVRRASEWIIHGERVVDDTRSAVLSIADVELPDGVRFEQYVLRVPGAAMVVVLDDLERVLMMWRHRFILDRWVWELPGGYLDPDEDPIVCATREVEEETGWRPRTMRRLLAFQPMVGTVDQPNVIYLALGADHVGSAPDINEAERLDWIPLREVRQHIDAGEIVGAGTVAGLLAVLLDKASGTL